MTDEDISYDPRGAQGYRSKDVPMTASNGVRSHSEDLESLREKLEFAEWEWNRATEGMKERDAVIESLRAQLASAREALELTQGAVHLLRKAIHAADPRQELDFRCHDIWTDIENSIKEISK